MLKLRKMLNKNRFLTNPLISGSFVLLAGNMIGNFCNYLYHLIMGRMLGPVDYGILESMVSLLYLLSIPIGTISLVIVKYVSQFKGEDRYKAIGKLYHKLNIQLLFFGLLGLMGYFLSVPLLAKILRLDNYLWLVMVSLIIFVTFFSGINRAFLQGLSKFFELSLSGVIESLGKLFLSIVFVVIGLKVTGAIGAILIAGLIGFAITKYFIKDKVREFDLAENLGRRTMMRYSLPVFISTLSMTSLFSTDIILARSFLTSYDAGLYSALALLGKIIFFLSGPIGMVMFPLISEYKAKEQNYRKIFLQSLVIVAMVSMLMTVIYFIAPKFIVQMLYGTDYLKAASSLGLFAVFLSLYSLSSIFVNYYLSIKKIIAAVFPLLAAILQIILIFLFHQNIVQIVYVSIMVIGLLLALLMLYYWKNERK